MEENSRQVNLNMINRQTIDDHQWSLLALLRTHLLTTEADHRDYSEHDLLAQVDLQRQVSHLSGSSSANSIFDSELLRGMRDLNLNRQQCGSSHARNIRVHEDNTARLWTGVPVDSDVACEAVHARRAKYAEEFAEIYDLHIDEQHCPRAVWLPIPKLGAEQYITQRLAVQNLPDD